MFGPPPANDLNGADGCKKNAHGYADEIIYDGYFIGSYYRKEEKGRHRQEADYRRDHSGIIPCMGLDIVIKSMLYKIAKCEDHDRYAQP